jgi:aspartate carbamoyltransferase catalytic subunit
METPGPRFEENETIGATNEWVQFEGVEPEIEETEPEKAETPESAPLLDIVSIKKLAKPQIAWELFGEVERAWARKEMGIPPFPVNPDYSGRIVPILLEHSATTLDLFRRAARRLGVPVDPPVQEMIEHGEEDKLQRIIAFKANEEDVSMILLRSPTKGVAKQAIKNSPVPIINIGEGSRSRRGKVNRGEHPTQALTAYYQLWSKIGNKPNPEARYGDQSYMWGNTYLHREISENTPLISGKTILIGGDLLNGHHARSFVYLDSLLESKNPDYPRNKLILLSPPGYELNRGLVKHLDKQGVSYTETNDMAFLSEADGILWNRYRGDSEDEYPKEYIIDDKVMGIVKPDAVILHHLHAGREIKPKVDDDPRAIYLDEDTIEGGVLLRAAIMKRIHDDRQRQLRQ